MNAIPKSAIKFLELQTVSLSSIGLKEPPSSKANASKLDVSKPKGFKSFFKARAVSQAKRVQAINDTRRRTYPLNIVSWLRFGVSGADSRLASLCLNFTDSKGSYVVIVDEQAVANATSAMMSGSITLETRGPLTELKVVCAGLRENDRCYIEDMNINIESRQQKIA